MSFRGNFETLILASLSDGPLHGYGIVMRIRDKAGSVFKTGESQLYPVLRRLEAAGFVCSSWEVVTGARERRLYELTPSGVGRLEKGRREWLAFRTAIDGLVVGPMEARCV